MRKLVALSLALTLGSGAVQTASADTVNVVVNPASYIEIEKIRKTTGGTTQLVNVLQPSMGTRVYYKLPVEVLAADLSAVYACLYDSAVATNEAEVDALCGHAGGSSSGFGANSPKSAIQMKFNAVNQTFLSDIEVLNSNAHIVSANSLGSSVAVTTNASFSNDQDNAKRVEFHFALSHATKHSNFLNWKVRAAAAYTPAGDNFGVVLNDTFNSYSILFYAAFGGGARPPVSYGEILANTSITETDIHTAHYFANDSATITMSGTAFESVLDATKQIPLSSSAPGTAENAFALECVGVNDGQATSLFVTETSKDLISDLVGSNEIGNVEQTAAAPTHDCTLSYGSGAEIMGEYRNVITLGIRLAQVGESNFVTVTPTDE